MSEIVYSIQKSFPKLVNGGESHPIIAALMRLGVPLQAIAADLEVHQSFVGRWLSGEVPVPTHHLGELRSRLRRACAEAERQATAGEKSGKYAPKRIQAYRKLIRRTERVLERQEQA